MTAGHRELLERIRMEYLEMPDMRLTAGQARKLWNLDAALCGELLDVLVEEGFLTQADNKVFRRHGGESGRSPVVRPI